MSVYGYDPYKEKILYSDAVCNNNVKGFQMFNANGGLGALNIICDNGEIKKVGNEQNINHNTMTETTCDTGYTNADIFVTPDNDKYISGLGFNCKSKYVSNPQGCPKTTTFRCSNGNIKGVQTLYNSDNIKSIRFICKDDKLIKKKLLLDENDEQNNKSNYVVMFFVCMVAVFFAFIITLIPKRNIRNPVA